MLKHTLAARALGLLVLASCGGDDDGSGGGIDTGLPAEEKLSDLDGAEAKQLCDGLRTGLNASVSADDRKQIGCFVLAFPLSITQSGSSFTGDVGKCNMLVNQCLSGETINSGKPLFELPTEFITADQCTETQATMNIMGCEATVSEFESCANAMVGTLQEKLAILACSSLSTPEKVTNMDAGALELKNQPACKPVVDKCPNLEFAEGE